MSACVRQHMSLIDGRCQEHVYQLSFGPISNASLNQCEREEIVLSRLATVA